MTPERLSFERRYHTQYRHTSSAGEPFMSDTDLLYPFTVRPLAAEDGGGYLVEFPDLPGCMAGGGTVDEALGEAADARRSWITTMHELGRPVPSPSTAVGRRYSGRWLMRVPRSLHRRLAERAREEGVSLNALATALLAEGVAHRDSSSGR
jgi:antitoxin HicB